MSSARFLINGQVSESVSVLDRGLQFGDGIFETFAVCRGEPLLWDQHLLRFRRGAETLGLDMPSEEVFWRESQILCRDVDRGVLKLMLTRGVSERGYAAVPGTPTTRALGLLPWPEYPTRYRAHGVRVQFCKTTLSRNPVLAGIKHLNRLEQVQARRELAAECAEGLMLDDRGDVVEGIMTNVFLVSRGALWTPDLSQCGVAGVMRGLVLERAAALPLECRITRISRNDILGADEIFLTNSLIGLWPVRRVDSREFPAGRVTQRLMEAIRDAHLDY